MKLILELTPVAYLLAVAVPLITTDIRERRLPNKLVMPSILITLVCWTILAISYNLWGQLLVAVACALVVGFIGVFASYKRAIGMGDVKLTISLVLVVAWFSWVLALVVPLVGFLVPVAIASVKMFLPDRGYSDSMPVGPYLIGSFAVMLSLAVM